MAVRILLSFVPSYGFERIDVGDSALMYFCLASHTSAVGLTTGSVLKREVSCSHFTVDFRTR